MRACNHRKWVDLFDRHWINTGQNSVYNQMPCNKNRNCYWQLCFAVHYKIEQNFHLNDAQHHDGCTSTHLHITHARFEFMRLNYSVYIYISPYWWCGDNPTAVWYFIEWKSYHPFYYFGRIFVATLIWSNQKLSESQSYHNGRESGYRQRDIETKRDAMQTRS